MVFIYKGDDVDFAGKGDISVSILSVMDITGFTGRFEFMGVVKDFSADLIALKTFSFTYSSEETEKFCLGQNYGIFTLFDTKHRKAVVARILVEVLPASCCGSCGDNGIFISMTNNGSYNSLADKPSIDGVTIVGDKTAKDYGLATLGDIQDEQDRAIGREDELEREIREFQSTFRGTFATWEDVPEDATAYLGGEVNANDYIVVEDSSGYPANFLAAGEDSESSEDPRTIAGTWHFAYVGKWEVQGKSGWHPEYAIGERDVVKTVPQKLTAAEQAQAQQNIGLGNVLTDLANAQTTAVDAQATADRAQVSADDAQATAVDAQVKANHAQSTADSAHQVAEVAHQVAEVAQAKAEVAQAKADDAHATANVAHEKAAVALETANIAQNRADEAVATANVAQNRADEALATAVNTAHNLSINYYTKAQTDDAISSSSATFLGTSDAPTQATFEAWLESLVADNNDYVFWHTVDASGNAVYKRYKYSDGAAWDSEDSESQEEPIAGHWLFEYELNNSSFSAEQWAAINSGITSGEVERIAAVVPSSLPPKMDGDASAGGSNAYARSDHVHPTDTSRASVINTTLKGVYTYSDWVITSSTHGDPNIYYVEWGSAWGEEGWVCKVKPSGEIFAPAEGDRESTSLTWTPGGSIVVTGERTILSQVGYRLGPDEQSNPNRDKPLASEAEAEALRTGKADKNDVDPLLFAQYYPDGSVKSAAEFTSGIKYNDPDTVNRTITVKPFCDTGDSANDNHVLVRRVVIPPFVDASGNGYISDDGTRFKVVGVSDSDWADPSNSLTAIVAPNTVTSIGGNAFAFCKALTTGSFPAVTTIEHAAFSWCSSLASVSFPAATSIGASPFYGCTALASVDFGDTPRSSVPTLGIDAFNDVPTTCKIVVPYTQYDEWKAADGWKDLQQEFVRHAEKADKPATFTEGNLAKFDSQGNPTDSGMNRDGNGNLDATEFTFTPAQVADYDSASVGTVISKAATPVVLHGGQHYVVRKSFVKTNGGWDADSVAGRVVLPGASGTGSTALGDATQAIGSGAVSTGKNTKASGAGALSSGQETDAAGTSAHAEGQSTSATATCAHSEGYFTIAQNQSEHAQGEYNASHTGATASEKTLNSIGVGDSNGRKNAVEVMRDGKVFVLGLGRYVGTNPTNSTDLASAVNAKADKPATFTEGNLAKFDANGNPTDSGNKPSDFQSTLSAQQLANIAAVSDALAFDATHSYAAGDPVVYNGTLYTFTSTHTGEWTGSDVSAVDITARLAGKLDKSGGTMTGPLTMDRSVIELKDSTGYKRVLRCTGTGGDFYIDYYDAQGTLVSSINVPSTSGTFALVAANPTAGNLAALDAQGNPTDSGIKPSDKLDATSAASAFSPSPTMQYEVGDHCTYNGKLYTCMIPTTGGTWDSSRWGTTQLIKPPVLMTPGNLASFGYNTSLRDSEIPVANVALKGEIPYSLGTPIVISTASSEVVEGETVTYGAALLTNRTANRVVITASIAELRIAFPPADSGKVRDFGLRVEVGDGTAALTAPALVPVAVAGETVTLENADGEMPTLADGTATAKGVTLLYFSETASGVFVVKGEQVEEVA